MPYAAAATFAQPDRQAGRKTPRRDQRLRRRHWGQGREPMASFPAFQANTPSGTRRSGGQPRLHVNRRPIGSWMDWAGSESSNTSGKKSRRHSGRVLPSVFVGRAVADDLEVNHCCSVLAKPRLNSSSASPGVMPPPRLRASSRSAAGADHLLDHVLHRRAPEMGVTVPTGSDGGGRR